MMFFRDKIATKMICFDDDSIMTFSSMGPGVRKGFPTSCCDLFFFGR